MFKKNKAFTLVELIITITITVIVIVPLTLFISKIYFEINNSNKKTNSLIVINDIKNKIDKINEKYLSWIVLIDNIKWSWSDILLFKSHSWAVNKSWYIFAQIDLETLKIDSNNNVENIWEKYFAYRKISNLELIDLETTPNNVYNYIFHLDKIFRWVILKDFQVTPYNNWEILELFFSTYINYSKTSLLQKYNEVKKKNLYNFILTF